MIARPNITRVVIEQIGDEEARLICYPPGELVSYERTFIGNDLQAALVGALHMVQVKPRPLCACGHPEKYHYGRDGRCISPSCGCVLWRPR